MIKLRFSLACLFMLALSNGTAMNVSVDPQHEEVFANKDTFVDQDTDETDVFIKNVSQHDKLEFLNKVEHTFDCLGWGEGC